MKRLSIALSLLVILLLLGAIAVTNHPKVRDFVGGFLPLLKPPPDLSSFETLPFTLPARFVATLYADGLDGARVLARDESGHLVVSQTSEGKITALLDTNGDGQAEDKKVILSGLNNPHGIIFTCGPLQDDCVLYVAETDKVSVYTYDGRTQTATFRKKLLDLPDDGGHYTRSLLLSADGTKLLVAVGSSCNVCLEKDQARAAITEIDLASGASRIFAKGLRNTVFMTHHPVTGDIWGTDMGRDLLGDDLPPEEINILRDGQNYGWPICYGNNIHDSDFDTNVYIRNPCMEPFETPAHIEMQAHSAPLGIAFVPEEGWSEEYWYNALVAFHGSWNRSTPTGYKVVRVPLNVQGAPTGPIEDFMTGFMQGDGTVIGRPVGILAEPGGTLYISDDRAGVIYRVSRTD